MGDVVQLLHWSIRYLVLIAGVLAIVASAAQWKRTPASGVVRITSAAFTGSLDLQILIGLFMLLVRPFYGALIGHISMMVMAAVIAHVGSIRARKREPGQSGAPLRVFAFTIALVLIVGGLMAIQRPVI